MPINNDLGKQHVRWLVWHSNNTDIVQDHVHGVPIYLWRGILVHKHRDFRREIWPKHFTQQKWLRKGKRRVRQWEWTGRTTSLDWKKPTTPTVHNSIHPNGIKPEDFFWKPATQRPYTRPFIIREHWWWISMKLAVLVTTQTPKKLARIRLLYRGQEKASVLMMAKKEWAWMDWRTMSRKQ
jgi:hypothetical protein